MRREFSAGEWEENLSHGEENAPHEGSEWNNGRGG
jgi:hypothetical protein